MSGTLLEWFVDQIEVFAPPQWETEREQLVAELIALQPDDETLPTEHISLFVLAQVLAAHQLSKPVLDEKPRRDRSAHESWYSKERARLTKLLQQIDESPVVSSFRATLHYYTAEDVTCPHGRNQKTCDSLYALGLTLELLTQYPALPSVRRQVDRLRQLQPHLPPLTEVCQPGRSMTAEDTLSEWTMPSAPHVVQGHKLADERTVYLLGTVIGRLRQAGLTVVQSCDVVDRLLSWCFDELDPDGERPAVLAEQWRRLC